MLIAEGQQRLKPHPSPPRQHRPQRRPQRHPQRWPRVAARVAHPAASVAKRFVAFSKALEQLLGRKVDLMTDHLIDNPVLRVAVDATRITRHDESPAEEIG